MTKEQIREDIKKLQQYKQSAQDEITQYAMIAHPLFNAIKELEKSIDEERFPIPNDFKVVKYELEQAITKARKFVETQTDEIYKEVAGYGDEIQELDRELRRKTTFDQDAEEVEKHGDFSSFSEEDNE